MDTHFDPRAYIRDARVAFELRLKDEHYVCSLCNHRITKSHASIEQLKATHLRKLKHQVEMKKKLGLFVPKIAMQPQISNYFKAKPKPNEPFDNLEEWKEPLDTSDKVPKKDDVLKADINDNDEEDRRRAEILEVLKNNEINIEEIGKLFFVVCKGSMPTADSISKNLEESILRSMNPFSLHPVASKDHIAMKFNNMNKFGFHAQDCKLVTTDRINGCNTQCSLVAKDPQLVKLIADSCKPK